jgi:hypothetical protein
LHGTIVNGRGVFTDEFMEVPDFGHTAEMKVLQKTYAGQCKDGYACGLGVVAWPRGPKLYAEYGPDGNRDGRCLYRKPNGTDYSLHERGKVKDSAFVSADGDCEYNDEACARDDPRLLALIALVAPVEVRPAAPATQLPSLHNSPPSDRPMDRPARFAPAGAGDRRCRPGAPPRRTPSLVVARHNPTAATPQNTSTQ